MGENQWKSFIDDSVLSTQLPKIHRYSVNDHIRGRKASNLHFTSLVIEAWKIWLILEKTDCISFSFNLNSTLQKQQQQKYYSLMLSMFNNLILEGKWLLLAPKQQRKATFSTAEYLKNKVC